MSIRYIVLVGQASNDAAVQDLLSGFMDCRFETTDLKVFTALDAPILLLPGNSGVLIGHLFSDDGDPILQPGALPHSPIDTRSEILRSCWGDYLLIERDPDAPGLIKALRDPSGAVACTYRVEGHSGFLTSDVSLAVRCGLYQREVDWTAIADTLIHPYRRSARTTLAGIRELLPGCSLLIDGMSATPVRQWSPWYFVSPEQRHSDAWLAAADVRQAVTKVVRSYSSLDQRILVQLSGGLDSSIVATSLGPAAERAILSTLVMPVAGTDERPYAKQVAEALHKDIHPVYVGMEDVSFDFTYPASAVLPIPGVLQHATNLAWETAATDQHVSALYSGSGGDTVFCYLKTAAPAADALMTQGVLAGTRAVRDLSTLHHCTLWTAGRLTLKKVLRRGPPPPAGDHSFLSPALVAGPEEPHPWLQSPAGSLPGDRERIADLIGTQLYRHARPFGETRTMRFPLLAQPVLEACLRTPSWMWIEGGLNRVVARDAFADRLPPGIRQRRSKGSYTGFLAGIYERNREEIRTMLVNGELASAGLLDVLALNAYIAQGLAPRDLSFLRLFDMCAVEAWIRTQRQCSSEAE